MFGITGKTQKITSRWKLAGRLAHILVVPSQKEMLLRHIKIIGKNDLFVLRFSIDMNCSCKCVWPLSSEVMLKGDSSSLSPKSLFIALLESDGSAGPGLLTGLRWLSVSGPARDCPPVTLQPEHFPVNLGNISLSSLRFI